VDEESGVHLVGFTDFPSRMADLASRLYCANLRELVKEMGGRDFKLDIGNEIMKGGLIVHEGKVRWPPAPSVAPATEQKVPAKSTTAPAKQPNATVREEKQPLLSGHKKYGSTDNLSVNGSINGSNGHGLNGHAHLPHHEASDFECGPTFWFVFRLVVAAAIFAGLGIATPVAFHSQLMIFSLAVVIGFHVIWAVTPALHTPLMSVTNAISGIIVVGSMLELKGDLHDPHVIIGAIGVAFAFINIVGGFFITQRMLRMFHK
jgi:NAD(P) transhydrogenase subunit alpha